MLSELKGDGGGGSVMMVGSGDAYRVYVFMHPIKHLTVVFKGYRVRIFRDGSGTPFCIHVTKGNDDSPARGVGEMGTPLP
jgi:hypothetical protein